MPRPAVRTAAIAAALVLAVVLTACSDPATPTAGGGTSTSAKPTDAASTTTAAGSSPAPDTTAGVPVVGDCIEPVTPDSAGGPQLPALVPCDDLHGGEIVAVSTLSDGPDAAYPAVTELTGAAADARAACQGTGEGKSEFDEFVGDNRLESPAAAGSKAGTHSAWIVSSLEAVLFVPGPAAWSKGERWAACAAVLRNSSGALSEYEGSAKGLRAPGKLTEAFAWCRTDEDQSGDYAVVGCDQPHSLEQVASFSVGNDTETYPGNDPIDVLAGDLCPGLASAATAKRSDSVSTKKYGLSWTFPREDDWANGDRTGRCYLRSIEEPTTGSVAAGTV